MNQRISWKSLLLNLAIPLAIGGLSAFLTMQSMSTYQNLVKPPLAPPGAVFPIVWTILFLLMGISSYLIVKSDSPFRKQALIIYGLQLLVNFIWPILFFSLETYLLAFVWLVLLWVMIAVMILTFWKVNKTAAYLQLPYFLWVTFAGYLNLMIYLLNP